MFKGGGGGGRRAGTGPQRGSNGPEAGNEQGQGPRGAAKARRQRTGPQGAAKARRQGTGPQWAGYKTPRDSSERLQFRKDLFTLNDLDACWFVAAWLLPALPLGLSSL